MPFFDDSDRVERAIGTVSWDFRLVNGKPDVVDPVESPTARARGRREIATLDLAIIDRAIEMLHDSTAWNRSDTRQCPPRATRLSLYCALELATLERAGSFDHRGTVMDDARAALDTVSPHHPDYEHYLMGYNNDPATAFDDIQRVLRVTRAKVAARLSAPAAI
jgi:hypothetical protein